MPIIKETLDEKSVAEESLAASAYVDDSERYIRLFEVGRSSFIDAPSDFNTGFTIAEGIQNSAYGVIAGGKSINGFGSLRGDVGDAYNLGSLRPGVYTISVSADNWTKAAVVTSNSSPSITTRLAWTIAKNGEFPLNDISSISFSSGDYSFEVKSYLSNYAFYIGAYSAPVLVPQIPIPVLPTPVPAPPVVLPPIEYAPMPYRITLLRKTELNSVPDDQGAIAEVSKLTSKQLAALTSDQVATFTKSMIAALTTLNIRGLTTEHVSILTTTQISGFEPRDLNVLATNQWHSFDTQQISELTTAQMNKLASRAINRLSAEQVEALTTAQVSALSPTNIQGLSTDHIRSLNLDQLNAIETADLIRLQSRQIRALTSGQLRGLTQSRLDKFSNQQVRAMSSEQVSMLSSTQISALSTAFIRAISPSVLSQLPASFLSLLQTRQITHLSLSQVRALTTGQIKVLDNSQIGAVSASAIGGFLPSVLASFSTAQMSGFTTANLRGLNSAQLMAFSSEQIAHIDADEVKVLSSVQLKGISAESVKGLSVNHLDFLTSTSLKGLSTNALAAMSTGQISSLSVDQLCALTAAQEASLSSAQKAVLDASQQTALDARTPLALDLTGQGVRTLPIEAGVRFDIDADGDLDAVGWIDVSMAYLVRDLNANGAIDSGAELFGDATLLKSGETASDGFEALASIDSNLDGWIDLEDEAVLNLKLWRDSNKNGVSEPEELISLASQDVAQISIASSERWSEVQGNLVSAVAPYLYTDGTQGMIADLWLKAQTAADLGEAKVSELGQALLAFEASAKVPQLLGLSTLTWDSSKVRQREEANSHAELTADKQFSRATQLGDLLVGAQRRLSGEPKVILGPLGLSEKQHGSEVVIAVNLAGTQI